MTDLILPDKVVRFILNTLNISIIRGNSIIKKFISKIKSKWIGSDPIESTKSQPLLFCSCCFNQ